jgi:hypothetical protein
MLLKLFFFLQYWGLNSGLALAKQELLPLEPHHHFLLFVISEIGSLGPCLAWTKILLFMLIQVTGMTGMHHHSQLFHWLWWTLANFLPRLASNPDPPDLHLLSSWDYRLELPWPMNAFEAFFFLTLSSNHRTIQTKKASKTFIGHGSSKTFRSQWSDSSSNSTHLASMRPWVQTPVLPKNK